MLFIPNDLKLLVNKFLGPKICIYYINDNLIKSKNTPVYDENVDFFDVKKNILLVTTQNYLSIFNLDLQKVVNKKEFHDQNMNFQFGNNSDIIIGTTSNYFIYFWASNLEAKQITGRFIASFKDMIAYINNATLNILDTKTNANLFSCHYFIDDSSIQSFALNDIYVKAKFGVNELIVYNWKSMKSFRLECVSMYDAVHVSKTNKVFMSTMYPPFSWHTINLDNDVLSIKYAGVNTRFVQWSFYPENELLIACDQSRYCYLYRLKDDNITMVPLKINDHGSCPKIRFVDVLQ